jgi:hypothetical protein
MFVGKRPSLVAPVGPVFEKARYFQSFKPLHLAPSRSLMRASADTHQLIGVVAAEHSLSESFESLGDGDDTDRDACISCGDRGAMLVLESVPCSFSPYPHGILQLTSRSDQEDRSTHAGQQKAEEQDETVDNFDVLCEDYTTCDRLDVEIRALWSFDAGHHLPGPNAVVDA